MTTMRTRRLLLSQKSVWYICSDCFVYFFLTPICIISIDLLDFAEAVYQVG